MNAAERLAWSVTRRLYSKPIIGDVPRSRLLHAGCFGTTRKVLNYARLLLAYRRHEARVQACPALMRIDPTSVCNLRCPLCPTGAGEIDRPPGMFPMQRYRAILDEVGQWLFCINLWGWGEPLLNKQLPEMAALARVRRIGTEVSTNLSVPLSDTDIDRLVDSGLTWLIVSANGSTKETYGRYSIGGDFELVAANIRRIAERKRASRSPTPFIEWQFVPLRHNEHEIDDAFDLALRTGADGLRLKPVRVDKTGMFTFEGNTPANLLDWVPSRRQLRHVLEPPHEDAFHPWQCTFLWRSMTVHHDGGIAPCCEVYRIKDDIGRMGGSLLETWNGPAYQRARRIASGVGLPPSDTAVACCGCKVFTKPCLRQDDRDRRRVE